MKHRSGWLAVGMLSVVLLLRLAWVNLISVGMDQRLSSPSLAYVAHAGQFESSTFLGASVHTSHLRVSLANGMEIWKLDLEGARLDWTGEGGMVWQPDSSGVVFVGRSEDGSEVRVAGPSFPPVKSVEQVLEEGASAKEP